MGQLDAFQDMTGKMNQLDQNNTNILNIIDELNRNSEQLDSLTGNLSILTYNSIQIDTSHPPSFNQWSAIAQHGLNAIPAALAYYSYSTDSKNASYQVPNYILDGSGNLQYYVYFYTDKTTLQFYIQKVGASPPSAIFTFTYYLLQQPANIISIGT